jgi:hypothetical protein
MSPHKLHRLIAEIKLILLDVALLILFLVALVKFVRSEIGW